MHLERTASRIGSLPLLRRFSPPANAEQTPEILEGYRRTQLLARQAVAEVGNLLQEGWSEKQTARLLNTYLEDCGVRSFFHKAFVWFGERTRFDGIKNYAQFSPTERVLLPKQIFILDVAPIYEGYICDIGYTSTKEENPELERAKAFLAELRDEIPGMFLSGKPGGAIWDELHEKILSAGYDNIHAKYPFSVLGHRVHHHLPNLKGPSLLNFGWQSYWSLFSRGLFGQLLNSHYEGDLVGLWAIEPHIGAKGFGAKFEEILVVTSHEAYWLDGRFGV